MSKYTIEVPDETDRLFRKRIANPETAMAQFIAGAAEAQQHEELQAAIQAASEQKIDPTTIKVTRTGGKK